MICSRVGKYEQLTSFHYIPDLQCAVSVPIIIILVEIQHIVSLDCAARLSIEVIAYL